MSQLDCNVKSCCHNEDNCCCLSSIEVNGSNACNCEDTCCGSYFEDKSGEKNSAQTPHVSLSIACQATNCMYNDDKVCHADHVDISGIRATAAHETVCATFQEKQENICKMQIYMRGIFYEEFFYGGLWHMLCMF